MLTAKNNKTCIKSDHPSVFICDKEPEHGQARITHRKITRKLKNLKKKERKRKKKWKRQKRLRAERMKKKIRGMYWGRNRGNGKFGKWKEKRNRKNLKKRNKYN